MPSNLVATHRNHYGYVRYSLNFKVHCSDEMPIRRLQMSHNEGGIHHKYMQLITSPQMCTMTKSIGDGDNLLIQYGMLLSNMEAYFLNWKT